MVLPQTVMNVLPLRTEDPLLPKTNFAGLDALRASAALGVVLLHSCVPYLSHPMPGLAWPVRDTTSPIVDVGFWSIELFIMPLFLLLAGFLAWRTIQRRGPVTLVKSRARRLLAPLLFGIVVILPLDLYSWVLGWVAEGLVPPVKLRSLKFDGGVDRDLWGLSHLWFLQYLFLYVVMVALAASARTRFAVLRRVRPGPLAVTLFVLVTGSATLYLRPEVVWGFQHSFLPVPSKWVYSGLFFVFGAMLAAHDGQFLWLKTNVSRLIAPTIMLSTTAVVLGRWHLAQGDQQLADMTLAALTCSSALLVSITLLGIAVKRIDRVPRLVSYLAAGSFWVYIVHHPILGLVHLDLKWMLPGISPIAKTLVAFIVTSGVCLLTYEGFARRTALGRWLGFSMEFSSSGNETGDAISVGDPRSRESAAGQSPLPAPRKAA